MAIHVSVAMTFSLGSPKQSFYSTVALGIDTVSTECCLTRSIDVQLIHSEMMMHLARLIHESHAIQETLGILDRLIDTIFFSSETAVHISLTPW